MNLFLVPATEENIRASITRSVPWNTLQRHLPEYEFRRLQQSLRASPVHCWAVTRNRQPFYDSIVPGDMVLMTQTGTGLFDFKATTIDKVRSEPLGNAIWPNIPNLPWAYIYFLKDISRISKQKRPILNALDYDPQFPVQGSIRVGEDRLNRVLRQYGSLEAFLAAMPGGEGGIIAPIDPPEPRPEPIPPPVEYIVPPELERVVRELKVLRDDSNHTERAHESIVELFYDVMGYQRHTEIVYRQGRVDIMIMNEGTPHIVNEVKRDWGLTRRNTNVVAQAFNYAYMQGVPNVVITNGDYYAWFDRTKGLSYVAAFDFELRLTELTPQDLPKLERFRNRR